MDELLSFAIFMLCFSLGCFVILIIGTSIASAASKREASGKGKLFKTKHLVIAGIILLCVILGLLGSCGDEATTYYIDRNGNGKEDRGEAQYYEDKDGIHWFD